jgi:hypothetical protein
MFGMNRSNAARSARPSGNPSIKTKRLSKATFGVDSVNRRPYSLASRLIRRANLISVWMRNPLVKLNSDDVRWTLFTIAYGIMTCTAVIGIYKQMNRNSQTPDVARLVTSADVDSNSQLLKGESGPNRSNQLEALTHLDNSRIKEKSLVAPIALLILAISLWGWENLVAALVRVSHYKNWGRVVASILRNRKSIAESLALVVALCSLSSAAGLAVWVLWANGHKISIILLGVIIGCSMMGFVIWLVVQMIWDSFLDRKVFDRGVPERVTADHVLSVLTELRSAASRRKYLQRLLSRRVTIVYPDEVPIVTSSSYVPQPGFEGFLYGDPGVAEDWAKLQEFWLGLSR